MPSDTVASGRYLSELPRLLLDHVPAILAYWDSTLRCRFANRACVRWFGVSPDAILGKPLSEFLGPLYRLNLPHIERVLAGEPQQFEREIPDPKGGPPRYSAINYIPDIVDGTVCGFFVLLTDITEIKRAKSALEESEARLSGILATSADAIISIDSEQRIVLFNEGAVRIFGWTREQTVGQRLDMLIPERFRAIHREHVREFARKDVGSRPVGRGGLLTVVGLRRNGEEFPAEASLSKLGLGATALFTASLRDISERKRFEDERQIFVALLDNAPDFIGIADAKGIPIYLNPAGRRMVGLPLDFPIERTQIQDYYTPEQRAFAADVILRAMTEHGRWSGESSFRNWQTGAAIPVSDEHFVIRDPASGRVLGHGTVTRDISEARKVAREREELLARERQAREYAEATSAKLRESEERFRLAIDEAPIGMALVALDGRFVRVNRALCEIVGYSADELVGLTFQAITHPEDLDADVALAARLARGEIPRYQLEKRYLRKDGGVVDIMLSASVLRDPAGAALYYITQIEDIGERKRLERELRIAEAQSTGILAISADAIVSVDEQRRITMFNEGAERIFGYTRSEAVGASLDLLIPERLRAVHRGHVEAFARSMQPARRMGERGTTVLGRRKSGEEFAAAATISRLEVGGRTVLTVALHDISEQKRAQEEHRFLAEVGAVLASSLNYELTLAKVAELAVRDLADLCIVEIIEEREEVRRLNVASRDPSKAWLCDWLTRLPLDRSRPGLLQSALKTRRPMLMQRPSEQMIESLAQSEEHRRVLLALEIQAMIAVPLLAQERLLGAIGLISSTPSRTYGPADVRLAEELAGRAALSVENAKLYRAARRATQARDELLGVVAHDLRNPLNGILLATALLRRGRGGAERRSQSPCESIERAAKRMSRLIDDLLDVSQMEGGSLTVEPSRLSVEKIVADAIEGQRALAASASLEIRQEIAQGLPYVWADRDRLLQVFENLIGNAIKFTAPSGQIIVGAAPAEGEVLFTVRDTGSGVAAEDLPRLFDRFWQGKTPQSGAGLGLPIVKGIIDAHHGRIWVTSTPDRGSTFSFTIPAAHESGPVAPAFTSRP